MVVNHASSQSSNMTEVSILKSTNKPESAFNIVPEISNCCPLWQVVVNSVLHNSNNDLPFTCRRTCVDLRDNL